MTSTLIPCLRYHDAPAMVAWLCDTFGFRRHLVVDDGIGGIAHAQLTFGPGMIMLSSVHYDEFDSLQSTPKQLGGTTQSPYLVVPDPDLTYSKAKAAGAEIVIEIADQEHGGRAFSCRDPEGHLWNVGDYDPWKETG